MGEGNFSYIGCLSPESTAGQPRPDPLKTLYYLFVIPEGNLLLLHPSSPLLILGRIWPRISVFALASRYAKPSGLASKSHRVAGLHSAEGRSEGEAAATDNCICFCRCLFLPTLCRRPGEATPLQKTVNPQTYLTQGQSTRSTWRSYPDEAGIIKAGIISDLGAATGKIRQLTRKSFIKNILPISLLFGIFYRHAKMQIKQNKYVSQGYPPGGVAPPSEIEPGNHTTKKEYGH